MTPFPFVLGLGATAFVAGCNAYVLWVSRGRRYASPNDVPRRTWGLVLGCAPCSSGGRPNRYFVSRLDAAAALYRAGKVQRFVLSGGANEVQPMRRGLQERQVPADCLTEDVRGLRTWTSMRRVQSLTHARDIVIVTQAFHIPRAVFLAVRAGLDPLAFVAEAPPKYSRVQLRLQAREVLARSRAVLDVWFR